jgi:WD40 repeat protein
MQRTYPITAIAVYVLSLCVAASAAIPGDPIVRLKLPDSATAACAGGGGKYLCIYIKKLNQMAVIDVAQQKLIKYLPMADEHLVFVASSRKLFVGLIDSKEIQKWDLETLLLEQKVPAPEGGMASIAAAPGATGPVLLAGEKRFWQIDPATLAVTRCPSKAWGNDGGVWGPQYVHVSYDGTTAVACGGGWAGLEISGIVNGTVDADSVRQHTTVLGDTLISGDGNLLFPDINSVLHSDTFTAAEGLQGSIFPAIDPGYSICIPPRDKKHGLIVFNNGDPRPLVKIETLPELEPDRKLSIAERVFLIPSQQSLVTLGDDGKQLYFRKFDFQQQLANSKADYLLVASSPKRLAERGMDYSYELKVQSNAGRVKTELQAGPAGMTLNADGKLTWAVPKDFKDHTTTVIIQISDASGQAFFHSFIIRIVDQPGALPMASTPQPSTPQPTPPPARSAPSITRIALPATVDATCVGGGGKYLILHLNELGDLAVIDVAQSKVLKYLPMPIGPISFCAGREKLFVGLKDRHEIQRWDLASLKLETTVPAPEGGINQMAIGENATGPLFLTGDKHFWQLDPVTLIATPVQSDHGWFDNGHDAPGHIHVSFDGNTLVATGGREGIEVWPIDKGSIGASLAEKSGHSNDEDCVVSGQGDLLILGGHNLFRSDLTPVPEHLDGQMFPTDDPSFCASVQWSSPPKLTLFSNSTPQPLLNIADLPELDEDRNSPLPIWQRVHLIPSQNVLITLGGKRQDVLVRPFDVSKQLAASNTSFLFVESAPPRVAARGSTYSYPLKIQSKAGGVKLDLQGAPAGMKLDDQTLTWPVPANFLDPTATVIMQISDAGGQSMLYTFIIHVYGPAVASAPGSIPGTVSNSMPAVVKTETPMVVKVKEPFSEFHPANGGRNLVFLEKKSRALIVYDTATGKEVGTIPVAMDDVQFTCGRDAIIVALPAVKILQRYELKTLQRTKSAPIPDPRPLCSLKMGSDSTGDVFLYFGGDTLVPINSQTLEPIDTNRPADNNGFNHWFGYRVSADGNTVVTWDNGGTSPFKLLRVVGNTIQTTDSSQIFGMGGRQFSPTADGRYIFYATQVYAAMGRELESNLREYRYLVPTVDPRFCIAVHERSDHGPAIALCKVNDRQIISVLDPTPEIGDGEDDEPREIYLPETSSVAFVPKGDDQFVVMKLQMPGMPKLNGPGQANEPNVPLAVISIPPAEVQLRRFYRYQIELLPPQTHATYKVEAGPSGLTVDATGMVTWNPPLEDLGKTVDVILSIRDAAGHEVPQAFDIHFVAPADGNGFIKANPTTARSAASASQPAADSIAKMDENRIRLPQGNSVYTPGMNGHMLLLVKDQLAILSADGFSIEQKLLMPKAYLGIGERKDYYVGVCDNPSTVDIIDKSSLKVIRSRVLTYPRLTQLALNPTLPISYIVYQDGATERMKHLIALDETTGKARSDDDWTAGWLAVARDGSFLMSGGQNFLARYDLDPATGCPTRLARRTGQTGFGINIRMSDDGKRVALTSYDGPENRANIAAWNPADLSEVPLTYLTKGIASTRDIAFHPVLPLVACYGKRTVAFFNRDTGQPEADRVGSVDISEPNIERIYFSPDGRSVILQTDADRTRTLYHLRLKLSEDEQKTVSVLPLADPLLKSPKPFEDTPAAPLQKAQPSTLPMGKQTP